LQRRGITAFGDWICNFKAPIGKHGDPVRRDRVNPLPAHQLG
jgi:hypothetical protein